MSRLRGNVNKTSHSVGRMGSKFAVLGKVAGAALAAVAAVGVTRGILDSVKAASDLNEAMNAVNVTFGKSAKGIKKLGDEAATTVGLSKTEFAGLSVQFSNFAKTVAGPGGKVVKTMDDLTTRAADFASVMNLDVNDAARLFQSGLAGESEPLRRYGIDVSAAAVESYAYAKGIAKAGAKLTEQQKVQARYGLIMKSTAKNAGDFANTSGGLANQQRILGANVDNLKAKLGKGLLPVVTSVVQFLNTSAIPFVTKFANGFSKEAGPAISKIGKWIKADLVPALKSIWEWLATKVYPIWKQYATFLITKVWPVLIKIAQQALEGVRAALDTVKKKIEENRPQLEALWAGFKKVAEFIVTKVVPVLGPVLKAAFEGAGIAFGFLLDVISKLPEQAKGILDYFIRPVTELFLMFAEKVVMAADIAFGWIPGLDSKLNTAKEAVKKFRNDTRTTLAGWSTSLGKIGEDGGKQINAGLQRGLRQNGKTLAEARYLAAKIRQQTEDGLEIRSPSKWAIRVGKFIGQGLAIGITKGGDKAKSAMTKMVDRLKEILDASRDKLRALRDSSKSYARDIASTIRSSGGLSATTAGTEGEADRKSTFGDISGQLSKALNQAKQFSTLVKRLRKQGVAKSLIAQVLQMGPGDGNSLAEAILQGGTSGIASLNKMQAELNKTAAQTGAFQANAQYGSAIAAQQARVQNQTNTFHIAVKADSPEEFIRQFRKYVRTHGGIDAVFG